MTRLSRRQGVPSPAESCGNTRLLLPSSTALRLPRVPLAGLASLHHN